MSDARLRELERRWRETGAEEDRLAWLAGCERRGEEPALAILGCVHSNLEALLAVWEDIAAQGVRRAVCLGDLVGYGPNPIEVVDHVREHCDWALKGNHDSMSLSGGLGRSARRSIQWTRAQLRPTLFSSREAKRRWAYLEGLPVQKESTLDLFVHGSPRAPTAEYILQEDIQSQSLGKFDEIFSAPFRRFLFVAHSHLPNVIGRDLTYLTPSELGGVYEHQGAQAIVNVGSVGQPRDRDPRACYLIQRGASLEWRRVDYDFEVTARKIELTPDLSDDFAWRLREGT